MGPDATRQIHVGFRADDSQVPETLLILLRLAHRRTEASTETLREHHRRDRGFGLIRLRFAKLTPCR